MLTRLATTLRGRQSLGGGIESIGGEGGEGTTVVLDENCQVRFRWLSPGLKSCFVLNRMANILAGNVMSIVELLPTFSLTHAL